MNSTTAMLSVECENEVMLECSKGYVGVTSIMNSLGKKGSHEVLFGLNRELGHFICVQMPPEMFDPGHCALKNEQFDLCLSNPLWTGWINISPEEHFISGNHESYHMAGKFVKSEKSDFRTLDIEKTSVPLSQNNEREITIDIKRPNEDLSSASPPRHNQNDEKLPLIVAVFIAVSTFTVALHPPSKIIEEVSTSLTRLFILFNSIGFFMSMATITLHLQVYPLKPWPTLFVFPLVGTYVISTVAIFPIQGLYMLLLASSFTLLATAFIYTYFGLRDRF